jgi:hypothetical protein
MFPRSCDRSLTLAGALVSLFLALPFGGRAEARTHPTIRVTTDRDTTRVKEITIDDEGIRIVGDNKTRIIVPGEVDVNDRSVRIHRVYDDSIPPIQIHTGGDNEIVQFFKDIHVEKGQSAAPWSRSWAT